MAEKSTRRVVTELDPMFYIPEGVDELAYADEGVYINDSDEDALDYEAIGGDSEGEEFFDDVDYSDRPETPLILGLAEPMVPRRTPAGQQVVDLILDVEELAGMSNYEFRVTKI